MPADREPPIEPPTEMQHKEGVVKWISPSATNNSFCLEEDANIWYNVRTKNEDAVEKLVKKGDKIKFLFKMEGANRVAEEISVLEKAKEQKQEHDEDMVNLEKLLDRAHEDGLRSVFTELIAYDMDKKWAVAKSTVTLAPKGNNKENRVFMEIGDASQENCGDMVKKHFIRMAGTRAVVRALRWATNSAKAAEEEKD